MTSNSATKKAIRERMSVTGEPYMEARRHVMAADAAWTIKQGTADPLDSLPYPWVLHADRSTHGFIDHGHLIGTLTDPDDTLGMTAAPEHLTDDDVQAMVGRYPVTRDRFTGQWHTWTHPIETAASAAAASERTRLYGGTREDTRRPLDGERAERRADIDRRVREDLSREGGASISELHFTDGLILDVGVGGVTSEGVIEEFVSPDASTDHVAWAEVVVALDDGRSDLTRLIGMCLRVRLNDLDDATQLSATISDVVVEESE